MSDKVEQEMRQQFEDYIRSVNPKMLFVARWPDGTYKNQEIQSMWEGWQAAIRQMNASKPEVRKALEDLYSVVIEQNRLGASWHETIFHKLMEALADASLALASSKER